jgi:hypothetical protein
VTRNRFFKEPIQVYPKDHDKLTKSDKEPSGKMAAVPTSGGPKDHDELTKSDKEPSGKIAAVPTGGAKVVQDDNAAKYSIMDYDLEENLEDEVELDGKLLLDFSKKSAIHSSVAHAKPPKKNDPYNEFGSDDSSDDVSVTKTTKRTSNVAKRRFIAPDDVSDDEKKAPIVGKPKMKTAIIFPRNVTTRVASNKKRRVGKTKKMRIEGTQTTPTIPPEITTAQATLLLQQARELVALDPPMEATISYVTDREAPLPLRDFFSYDRDLTNLKMRNELQNKQNLNHFNQYEEVYGKNHMKIVMRSVTTTLEKDLGRSFTTLTEQERRNLIPDYTKLAQELRDIHAGDLEECRQQVRDCIDAYKNSKKKKKKNCC